MMGSGSGMELFAMSIGNYYERVRILHKGRAYHVTLARTEEELQQAHALEVACFSESLALSMVELRKVMERGVVFLLRDPDSGEVVGESQLLLHATPNLPLGPGQAHCFGTAVREDHRDRGLSTVLYKAEELVARDWRVNNLVLTVQALNTASLRTRMNFGFRVNGFVFTSMFGDWPKGARLMMTKSLVEEPWPFEVDALLERLDDGRIRTLESPPRHPYPDEVAVSLGKQPDRATHELIDGLLLDGYLGTGVLTDRDDRRFAQSGPLLTLSRCGAAPPAPKLQRQPHVQTEYDTLREVVVNHVPFCTTLNRYNAINEVSQRHIGNVDTMASSDEYRAFVSALKNEGVRTVTAGAIGRQGTSAMFTRDPAFVIDDTLVIGHMANPIRRHESQAYRRMARQLNVLDLSDLHNVHVEGGDIVLLDEKRVAVGLGQRTNEAAIERLVSVFPNRHFIPVKHEKLHLDVIFTLMGKGIALISRENIDSDFLQFLERDNGFRFVEADQSEWATLACNVVVLRDRCVLAVRQNVVTNERIRAAGVEVVEVDIPNLIKQGGGPRCMTCPIWRGK